MLTLIEYAKTADPLTRTVIEIFAATSDILLVMPFDNIQGNAYAYNQEAALPGIGFRGINEAYQESTGILNPQTEALKIAGGDLDVDRFLVDTMGPGTRAKHEAMKIKALAHGITTTTLKGNSETNPREFDGLQRRVTGPQLIENGSTSGGDPLSLMKLDEAIDATDDPSHLWMNKTMRRRLTQAARNQAVGGNITYDVDAFGRQVTKYNDIPILLTYPRNGGTDPLAFDEAGGGGGTTATSIYVLSIGPGRLSGIQSGPVRVEDLGELQTEPKLRTRVDWYPGMVIEHPRAVTRLRGISNAAAVA